MNRGLKALKRIKENTTCYVSQDYDMTNYDADVEVVEKELKALEIMKNKECCISNIKGELHADDEYDYYLWCIDELDYVVHKEQILTEEEFKIIREVLAND